MSKVSFSYISMIEIDFSVDSRVSTLLRQSRHEGVLQTKHSDDHQSRSYFPKLTDQLQTNWLAERQQSSQHPNFLHVTLRTMSFKLFLIGFLLILYVSSFVFFFRQSFIINFRN